MSVDNSGVDGEGEQKSGRWALLKQVSSPHREIQREEELFSCLSIRDMAM